MSINSANFQNAYKEVYTILCYIDPEDIELIPENFMNMLKNNMNNGYNFRYNPNIEFENQNLLRETKAIFAYIFLHFWGDEKQKEFIKTNFRQDLIKVEQMKKSNMTTEEMFAKLNKKIEPAYESKIQITEYKKENKFITIINKFKKWLNKILKK